MAESSWTPPFLILRATGAAAPRARFGSGASRLDPIDRRVDIAGDIRPDAIAACVLGGVERRVDAAQYRADGIGAARNRHADTDGNTSLAEPASQIDQGYFRPSQIGNAACVREAGAGKHRDEFFAA
jgi:hypothetical protein